MQKFIRYALLPALVVVWVLGWQAPAVAQTGSVSGRVTDARSGDALPGSNVVVLTQQGTFVAGSSTDQEGNYAIENLRPGIYVVKASFIGYSDNSQEIELKSGSTLSVDLKLSESPITSDPVIITAGRRAEKVSESSANIQVVEPKTIEVSQEPTVFGIMKETPGIDYFETGLGQQQINARGFYSPFTGNMLVLVDNRLTTLPGIGGNFGPVLGTSKEDIKQVEVIVGPNSALYGANASAGVVNIITKDPKEYSGHSVTFSAGNRSTFRVGARSSAVINDKFGYKVSVDRFTADDFESYVNPTDDSPTTKGDPLSDNPNFNISNWVINGSLYFYPNDFSRISYTGGFSNANYINMSNIGRLQVNDFHLWYHQLRLNFDDFFGFGSLFVQGYITQDNAGDTYSLEDEKLLELRGLDSKTAQDLTTFVDKPKRYDLELQHNFSVTEKHNFTWGVQYRDNRPNSEGTFLSDGPNGEKIKIKETGVYGQYENRMIPNVRLTLTGRYDDNDEFGSRFSPKVAVSYRYLSHNFRFSYNEGFASPPIQPAFALSHIGTLPPEQGGLDIWLRGAHNGFTLLNVNTGATSTIKGLEPSDTKGFEVGYRGSFANKLLLDVTAYTTKYENFISAPIVINNPAGGLFVLDGTGAPRIEVTLSYINFGEVRVKGVDANAELLLNNNLSLSGSLSLSDFGDFKQVPPSVQSTPGSNSPETRAKGGLRFTNWWKRGTFSELTFRYVDSYTFIGAQAYNRGKVPSYGVFDLTIDVPFKPQSFVNTNVGLTVKNLFDNKHIELPGAPELGILVSGYVTFHY